jgi:hypothetical protein
MNGIGPNAANMRHLIIMMGATAWSWTALVGLAFGITWLARKAQGSALGPPAPKKRSDS